MEIIGYLVVFVVGLVVGFLLRAAADQSIGHERQLLQQRLVDLQQLQQRSEAEKNRVLQEQIGAVKEQLNRLDGETKRLNQTLNNDRMRGKWGETVALSVLTRVGFIEGMHYVQQTSLSTSGDKTLRPDYTFLLPNNQRVHMDCKFPFANYQAHIMSENPSTRDAILKAFERDVRKQIEEASKYITDDTLNCVLMFIPNEGLFHFVTESETIQEQAYSKRVILCSPQSLILMLELLQRAQQVINLDRSVVQARSALLDLVRLMEGFNEEINTAKRQINAANAALGQLETKQVSSLNKAARHLLSLLEDRA